MQGQILDFSIQTNSGVITAEDSKRYSFEGSEWKEATSPIKGQRVDFEVGEDGQARGVYKALGASGAGVKQTFNQMDSTPKNKVVAGLLALFLGGVGVHKFYLGMPIPGIIYLIGSFVCYLLFLATEEAIFLLPWLVITIFCLVDAILYFTKSEEQFQQVYVDGKKQWF